MSQPVRTDRMARFLEMTSPESEGTTLEEMFQRMTCRVDGVAGAEGRPEGLPAICAAWNIPYGRYLFWLKQDLKRYQVYLDALEIASRADISEVIAIADGDEFPQTKRVRIDTRFRLAESHAREMYGKRLQMEAPPVALVDAGLVGTAVALLQKLSQGRGREIDITPSPTDEDDPGI
jgi:hypothetical protein